MMMDALPTQSAFGEGGHEREELESYVAYGMINVLT